MLKNGLYLFASNAGKPLNKVVNLCAVLEILEERCHWYSGSQKNPSSANLLRVTFDNGTLRPIQHIE